MFYALAVGLFLVVFSAAMISVKAQPSTGLAARIVVIKPKEGMQKQFEEGYKRHLEWHRRNKDSWVWYGWQIIAGSRLGYFMDGTFGHRWENFDAAVSPAEDAADNALNVAPYGDFLSLGHYILRPDISRGKLLEDQAPSAFLELLHYRVHPGREGDFEEVMLKVHEAVGKSQPSRRYTWYQLINGGEQSTYILFVPHNKLSELQSSQKSLTGLLTESYPPQEAKRLLELLRAATRDAHSETLRYRADLSYFPPNH
jgi:hypothetical protein